jgi:hypothetical protein
MDQVVAAALFPDHPDKPSLVRRLVRFTTLARSHWVRMPPLMLAKHLEHKVKIRLLGEKERPADA